MYKRNCLGCVLLLCCILDVNSFEKIVYVIVWILNRVLGNIKCLVKCLIWCNSFVYVCYDFWGLMVYVKVNWRFILGSFLCFLIISIILWMICYIYIVFLFVVSMCV